MSKYLAADCKFLAKSLFKRKCGVYIITMSDTKDILKKLRDLKPRFGEMNIKRLALFGSHARGDADEDSDVDLLVEFDKPVGFFELIGTKYKFEEYLGEKVDVTTFNAIRKPRHIHILNEAVDV